ncbi:hypothetical protein SISNIDRAFT_459441, partial [Sistotremastrum niveocremeum HHB9708]
VPSITKCGDEIDPMRQPPSCSRSRILRHAQVTRYKNPSTPSATPNSQRPLTLQSERHPHRMANSQSDSDYIDRICIEDLRSELPRGAYQARQAFQQLPMGGEYLSNGDMNRSNAQTSSNSQSVIDNL